MKKNNNDLIKVKLDEISTLKIRVVDVNYCKIGDFDIKTLASKLK